MLVKRIGGVFNINWIGYCLFFAAVNFDQVSDGLSVIIVERFLRVNSMCLSI